MVTDLSDNSEVLNINVSDLIDDQNEKFLDFKEVIIESEKLIVACFNHEKGNLFSGYI